MAINNTESYAPAEMRDWVRQVETTIKELQATVASLETQVRR